MTPRERVLKTLNHEQPDIVPKSTRCSPGILKKFNDEVGAGIPDRFLQYDSIRAGFINNEILEEQNITTFEDYFNIEFRYVEFKPPQKINDFSIYHGDLPKLAKVDEWGIAEIPGKFEHYVEMRFPLARVKNIKELKRFPWPDPMQKYCHRHLDELTQKWHKKGYAVEGFMQTTIFEQAWYMRGLEDLFLDMMNDSPVINNYLLDKITEIKVAMARRYAEADVDVLREYGKYLSFWGTIGTRTTMPFGTVKKVKEVSRERIDKIGRFGGLVLDPTHNLQPDVPWENIVALFEVINEYKL